MEICRSELPAPTPIPGDPAGSVRCHLHTSGPRLAGAPIADYIATARPAGVGA